MSGSSSTTIAMNAEINGATPTVVEVRAGPESLIAYTNRICDTPGTNTPASRKGQTLCQVSPLRLEPAIAATAAAAPRATTLVTKAPVTGSGATRSARRVRTERMPKKKAPSSARKMAMWASCLNRHRTVHVTADADRNELAVAQV